MADEDTFDARDATIERLRHALSFYADSSAWDSVSEWQRMGKPAINALNGTDDDRMARLRGMLSGARAEIERLTNELSKHSLDAVALDRTRERLDRSLDHEIKLQADLEQARAEIERQRAALRDLNMAHATVKRDYERMRLDRADALNRVARLREALEFYGAAETWEVQRYEHGGAAAIQNADGEWCAIPAMIDCGKRAREALGK